MNHCLNEAQEFEREYYDAIEDYEITDEKYHDPEFFISASYGPQVGFVQDKDFRPWNSEWKLKSSEP